jgi:Bacterial TSP3 repeat
VRRFLPPILAILALAPCGFAIVDVNNNGLSDYWERQYNNGSLFSASFNPQSDDDGDGWSNAKEAVTGTDPLDGTPPDGLLTPEATHHPSVWVDTDDDGIADTQTIETAEVKWPSLIGKQYQLYGSADLMPETWLEVDEPRMGTDGEIGLIIPLVQPDGSVPEHLFWRVAVWDVDTDGDGLTNHEEHQFGTNSNIPMTFPGIPDAWLAANFTSPHGFDANGDSDGDGLTNALENRLGTDPNNPDIIGMINTGFGEEITDSPDMTFRDDHPSDLYDQSSVEGWQANEGQHIEIWDEGDGNPYAELQSHLGAHGIKQEFDMVPGTRVNFILRYKGRYDWEVYDNAFALEVQGASEMLVDGAPAEELDGARKHSFMDDDGSEKYADWHYVSVSITAETSGTGLKQLTLKLAPKTTTTYGDDGEEDITYGGFVDILPTDLDVNADGDLDDSCDGLALYMPGYEGNQPKLHSGDSFKDAEYTGPQTMNLIIKDVPSGAVDEATVRITGSSAWFGFCGNGKIPNDSPNPSYNDFSLTGEENISTTQEITIPVTGNQVIIPIYCHDYGAWCEVEIDLLSDSSSILSQPLNLTVPHDGNEDRLADLWQDSEINAWNDQFGASRPINDTERDKMKPGSGYDYSDYADDEEDDSDGTGNGDGGRNLPAMAAAGDGLKTLQEYRGFILDGGPGATAGRHKRLSAARKELLVEGSVENDLTSSNKNGSGTNQPALAAFTVVEAMSDVSDFYRDTQKGASIDLYWVEDELEQPGEWVGYAPHPFLGRGAWEWYGDVKYYDAPNMVWAAGVPLQDELWLLLSPDEHNEFYKTGLPNLKLINRNPELGAFVKLLLPTRTGYLKGGLSTDGNGQTVVDPDATQYFSDGAGGEHSNGKADGAHVCISAIADEGISYYRTILNRHFTGSEFSGLSRRVIAHELGHLIHDNHSGTAHGDTIMDDTNMVLPDGTVRSLTTSQWHPLEIFTINLPSRKSIDPSP